MKINNLRVYGLENSYRVSKFPKQVIPEFCDESLTNTIKGLGSAPRGSGHDNFLKGITVQFDLSCTNKMWIEAQRYHFFEIVSSQSTMHKIDQMDFDDCMCEYVTENTKREMERLREKWLDTPIRDNYLALLYNCPSGIVITAGVTTNYQQLKTIWYQRRTHKLPEWREFCQMIEKLPDMEYFLKK